MKTIGEAHILTLKTYCQKRMYIPAQCEGDVIKF